MKISSVFIELCFVYSHFFFKYFQVFFNNSKTIERSILSTFWESDKINIPHNANKMKYSQDI